MRITGLVAALLVGFGFVGLASGASISWGPEQQISGDSDVLNLGGSVTGVAFGPNGNVGNAGGVAGAPLVVNGVTFTNNYDQTPTSPTTAVSLSSVNQPGTPYAINGTLSQNYGELLSGGVYNDGNNITVQLNNLNVGTQYDVQVFAQDARGGFESRSESLDGGPTSLQYDTGSQLGTFALGTFTAISGTQTFVLEPGTNNQQINALTLQAVPEPGTLALFGLGAAMLFATARRRRSA